MVGTHSKATNSTNILWYQNFVSSELFSLFLLSFSSSLSFTMAAPISSSPTMLLVSKQNNMFIKHFDLFNFLIWQSLFSNILYNHQIYNYVDDSSIAPPQFLNDPKDSSFLNPIYTQWKQTYCVIVSWIDATISFNILKHIIQSSHTLSTYEVWLQIETLFLDHVKVKYMS